MKLHHESLRESHFEATVTRFEFPWRIGRKSEMKQVGIPRGEPGRQGRSPGFTEFVQDRTETRIKLKVARGQVARWEPGCAGPGRAGIGWAGLGSAGPARAPFEPGTQNSSFLFFGKFELRAACIYNQSQLGFLPAGFTLNPALPNGGHRLKMSFISPQRMGFDRHLS